MLRILPFLLFIFFPFLISAQTEVKLKNIDDIYLIGKSVSYLKIPADSLSFEEVLSKKTKFTPSQEKQLSFGFTTDVVWVKFTIDNQTDLDNWVIDIEEEALAELTFYYQEEGEWKKSETGNLSTFNTRKTRDTGFSFFLKVPAQTKRTFYLSVKGAILIIPLRVQSYEQYNSYIKLKNIYYGAYFGILLVMILYNLFLYFSIKDKNYLYYVFTIIATLGFFSSATGYNFMLFWADMPEFNAFIVRLFSSLLMVSTAILSIYFLQLKKYSSFLYYWMLVDGILAILYLFLPKSLLLEIIINNLFILHAIMIIIAAIFTWRKGHFFAKYYLFAWLLYILGGIIFTLRSAATLPSNFFTLHAVEIGSVLEVITISFALGAKYSELKKERELAIQEALTIEKKANEELENKVEERTHELQTSLEVVGKQNIDIEKKNNDMRASINYASRIQMAMLPTEDLFATHFTDYFILFKPRDVVSGDFYWAKKINNFFLYAAADCTGHGIPGAFISTLAISLLNEVSSKQKNISAGGMLDDLRKSLKLALKQTKTETKSKEGLDIALCIIDLDTKQLQFAGAYNPLYIIREKEFIELKADRQPIGIYRKEINFTNHEFHLQKGDLIYSFSDGFQDQFGGEKQQKFMSKNFKKLLLTIHEQKLGKQKELLEQNHTQWKGALRQIDDIIVLGVKV